MTVICRELAEDQESQSLMLNIEGLDKMRSLRAAIA
jgi:hypothetical protein